MPDTIADAFTIIRNAVRAKEDEVLINYSKILFSICEVLKREGYIENFKNIELGGFKKIKIYLKYNKKESALHNLQRISKSQRRIYVKRKKIPHVLEGHGIAILSTSCGILTDREAREKGLGGEVIGEVW